MTPGESDGGGDVLALAREAVAAAPERALVLAEQAVSNAATSRDRALAYQVRARSLRALGRHEEALVAFADAANAAQSNDDETLAAQVQIGAVDTLGMLARYDEADALAQTLVERLQNGNALVDASRVLGNLGSLHLRRDRYADALRVYSEAEALLAATENAAENDAAETVVLRAGLAINRAIALTYLGQQDEAATLYEQARALYQAQNRPFEAAVAASNIGFLSYTAGRHAAALGELTTAYSVFAEAGRVHEAARCDLDTGDAYRALNLRDEARACYERALQTFQALPLDDDRARAYLGLAAIAAEQGRTDEAQEALLAADAHFAATGNTTLQAHVRLRRADLLGRGGKNKAARTEANRAKRAFSRAGLTGWAAEAQLIAVLAADPGPTPASRDAAAIAALQRITRTAQKTRHGWLECRAENALGRQLEKRGERDAALLHFRRAVDVLEAARTQIAPEELHLAFLRDKEIIYADLITHLLQNSPTEADVAEALAAVERSRSRLLLERLLSAQTALPSIGDAAEPVPGVRERLADLRARLSRAYRDALSLSSGDDQSRHGESFAETALVPLENAYAQALRDAEMRGGFPETTLHRSPSGLAELQAVLDDDEALLLYCVVGGDQLAAFVLKRDHLTVHTDMAAWSAVCRTARRFRYHLQKVGGERTDGSPQSSGREINGVLEQLHTLLIAPLRNNLKGVERLVVVPCGVLHGLPFHALKIPETDECYLADQFEIIHAPSASVWHTLLTGAANQPAQSVLEKPVLVGVSSMGTENVTSELDAIARFMPPSATYVLYGKNATIKKVRAAAPTASLLHLATHALFRRDNSLFSGLQLVDDWLLGRDLYGMRLNAQLVTLSACDTGAARIEPGDEWMGLARGFLTAGARRVLVSLWPADDAATAQLMALFYRYVERGHSPASALRRSQREMRTRYSHPYYWAAFCLIGQR